MDASVFCIANICQTRMCPLAKVMRRELKKHGIRKLKVVCSEENPRRLLEDMSISCRTHFNCSSEEQHKYIERRDLSGSVAVVPIVVGLILVEK